MEQIVVENYPTKKLPADLRKGLDAHGTVKVILVEEQTHSSNKKGHFSRFFDDNTPTYKNHSEITDYIRSMRDEWEA
jgi:hypothetical protein